MLLNRSGLKSSSSEMPVASPATHSDRARAQRRAAAIGLAVAATVSVASVTFSRLHAQDASSADLGSARPLSLDAAASSDADLLKQGLAQAKAGQYEDAKATLAQVKAEGLSAGDQKKLASAISDADQAILARQDARTIFNEGEDALKAGNLAEARDLYKKAADAKYADDATRQKAREQIALVGSMQEQAQAQLKAEYLSAKADYEAGNYDAARPKFEKLQTAGFKQPLFQTSPSEFIKKIDQKVAQAPAEQAKAAAKAQAEAAAKAAADAKAEAKAKAEADKLAQKKAAEDAKLQAEAEKKAAAAKAADEAAAATAAASAAKVAATTQQAAAHQSYEDGVAALHKGDFAAARTSFKAADAAGYKPGLLEASPAKMLVETDRQEQAAADKAAKAQAAAAAAAEADKLKAEQAEAKAKAEQEKQAAKAAQEQQKLAAKTAAEQEKAAAATRQAGARQLYKEGLDALHKGDFTAARVSFKAADDAGFKAGLFEDSAVQMLAEVDKDEAAAQTKAAKAAAADKANAEKLAAKQAADAQAQAQASAAAAEKASATTRQASARELYKSAKAQYDKGDWIAARQSFTAAAEAGYKPGVFEDSPATYLARMDRKEQADAKKAAAAAAKASENAAAGTAAAGSAAVAVTSANAAVAEPATQAAVTPAAVAATPTAVSALEATAKMDQIKAQARQYEAQTLVEQADAALKANKQVEAGELYTKAAELDPQNQQAIAGRNQILTLQGRPAQPTSLLDSQIQLNKARREQIVYEFNAAIEKANAAKDANDFKGAQLAVQKAAIARDSDPNLFTQEEIRAFNTQLATTTQQIAAAKETYDKTEAQRQADEAVKRQEQRLAVERKERDQTVATLISQSRTYIKQDNYTEALATLDQVLRLDPSNEFAKSVRPLVEDHAILQQQREYRERYNIELRKQLNQSQEKQIPYDDIYRYPANWPDIVESRDRLVGEERGLKEADRAVQALLDKPLPEVKLENAQFGDVIDFLRDISGANIVVNWKALEGAQVDRTTTVNVRLRDVKFSKVLSTVLEYISADPNNKITYTVSDGVITVSTQTALSSSTTIEVYDITDLIIEMPQMSPDDLGGFGDIGTNSGNNSSGSSGFGSSSNSGSSGSNRSNRSSNSNRSSSGSGSGGLFGGGSSSGSSRSSSSSSDTDYGDTGQRLQDVSDLIQATVASDTWEESGAGTGKASIRPSPVGQQLIVTQTPENHQKIRALLDKLRESKAIQVTVEARFLTVSRNFFQDVGMDLDLKFNVSDPDKWSPIVVTQNTSDFTKNPQTGVPGSLGSTSGSNASLNGLTATGTYLDDFQATFLVRATQASQNQSLVTAPRVTVYNGQSARVLVTTLTSYVAELDPVVADGVVGYTPTIDQAEDGVSLFVRATVSADRKYVTLYLRPQLQRLLELTTFSFQQAATTGGGSGTGTGSTGGNVNGLIVSAAPTLTIQEPRTQVIEVETLASVPDGGTLLLGGLTIAGETEKEAGVPILSKIPILKRLFTNRSNAKDEQVVLILVKPIIIIQREQEQKQFPLLSSKIGGGK